MSSHGDEATGWLADKQRAMEDERIRDVRKVLTPAQQAKLVLLMPRLERDFAHWIHEIAGRGED